MAAALAIAYILLTIACLSPRAILLKCWNKMSIMYFNSLWIIQRVACILYKTARAAAAATLKFWKRDASGWRRLALRAVACNTRPYSACLLQFRFSVSVSLGVSVLHTRYYSNLVETDNLTTRFSVSICCFVVVVAFCFLPLVVSAIKCNKLFSLCQMHICFNNNCNKNNWQQQQQ